MTFIAITSWIVSRSRRDEGQTLVEYALILALVSIAAIGTLAALGVKVNGVLTTVADAL